VLDPEKKLNKRVIVYAGETMYVKPGEGDGWRERQGALNRDWLEYRNSQPDMALVKERLGVEVLVEDLDELARKASGVDEEAASVFAGKWLEGAREIEGEPRELMKETARWYVALRRDLEEKKAAGFTTICSRIGHRYGCNPCFAFMMLADEGYGFSCGIDMNGLLTELMLNSIEPGAMFQGNLMVQNLPEGRVSIHHCMAPYSMDFEKRFNVRYAHSKPERKGLASGVRFRKGPVTLARLDMSLESIHVSAGTLVDYVNYRDRCINEAVIEVPSPEEFERLRIKPRPPSRICHYVMRYGDCTDALCEVAEALGMECLKS